MKFRIGYRECAVMGLLVATAFLILCGKKYGNVQWESTDAVSGSVYDGKMKENSEEKTSIFGKKNAMEKRSDSYGDNDEETAGGKKTDRGKLALTFDDGPHPNYTAQLLDGLKKRGVKATFFVTGEHAELHPEIIKRMSEEGHCVGNHTYSHMQLKASNKEAFKQELIKTNEIITGITGEEVLYVRPPYGTWDKKFETELNMFPVLWSVDPLDWCSSNVSCITEKVVNKVKENDIILMHDYYDTSVTAALKIVDELLEEGFEFVTVEEILFD